MKYSEHYGSIVTVTDTRNGERTEGKLIEVRPGFRITLAVGLMDLKTIRIGKRDIADISPGSDAMTIRTKPATERHMRVKPLSESAYRMMESILQSLQSDAFDGLMESKLG